MVQWYNKPGIYKDPAKGYKNTTIKIVSGWTVAQMADHARAFLCATRVMI